MQVASGGNLTAHGRPASNLHQAHKTSARAKREMLAGQNLPPVPLSVPLSLSIRYYFQRPKAHYTKDGDLKADAPVYSAGHL